MNELIEPPIEQEEQKASIIFSFTNGSTYTQDIFWKQADLIEEFLMWYRDKKSKPTWTFDYTPVSKIMLIQKSHIMTVEVEGYIELTRLKRKWHEALIDKIRTWMIARK